MDPVELFGYVLAVMGSVAFIPQIQLLLKSKSGEGLDLFMFSLLDFITCIVTTLCIKSGLDISNWLEVIVTNMQVFSINLLARYYLQQHRQISIVIALKLLLICILYLTPLPWIKGFMSCLLPVALIERSRSVYTHYKNKSTGQLSGTTLALQWTQFSGRIFTSVMAGAEVGFILPHFINSFFTTIILGQYLWYKPTGKQEKSE